MKIQIAKILVLLSSLFFSCNAKDITEAPNLNSDSIVVVENEDDCVYSIEHLLRSKTLSKIGFENYCTDTLVGIYLLQKINQEYDIMTFPSYVLKNDFLQSSVDINDLFDDSIKGDIILFLKDLDKNKELEGYFGVPLESEDEFESSKLYYFVKHNNCWLFAGIKMAG